MNSKDLKEKLSDQYWRMNNLYYIINEKGERVKFRFNKVQEVLYKTLWYLSLILKSRQHGVTTYICIYFLDVTLFNSNIRAGIIAHNREDAESFFSDKVKYAYDNLPDDLKELRPADTSNTRELKFSNNSAIRVGTSMRSATLQYLHISEFGKICRKYPEKAKEIVTGSLNTVHAGQFVAIESTAEGQEGYFYDYCHAAQKKKIEQTPLSNLDFRFLFFPWFQDARNRIESDGIILPQSLISYFSKLESSPDIQLSDGQKAWYAKKWKLLGDEMYREHPSTPEEAFMSRIEGAYFRTQFSRIYKENRIHMFPVEDGIKVDTWWDLGIDDETVIWFTQTVERELHVIDFYQNNGEGLAHYSEVLQSKEYRYGTHTAPHDINKRELGTGMTLKQRAIKYGIKFKVAPRKLKINQIEAARNILQHCHFHKQNCEDGVKALESYRREWNDKLGTYRDNPLHDWASHAADAFMVMAVTHKFGSGVTVDQPIKIETSNFRW